MVMRVLHIIPSLAARDGGPTKAVVEMCRELVRRGHQAAIYTTNLDGAGELDVPLEVPVNVMGAQVRYFSVGASKYYKISSRLAAALRSEIPNCSVVHIHSLYQFPSTIAAHYCRRFRVPYLIQPHGVLDPFMYRHHRLRKWLYEILIERRNLKGAAAVHFTTRDEMALARSHGLIFRSAVVPLGVGLEQDGTADGALLRRAFPETFGKRLILFFGRLNFKKGLDILAHAFGEVGRRCDDVHLVIGGPDNDGYSREVKDWLRGEGVLAKTTFAGMLLGELKAATLAAADLFVLPSYTENFGIAVVEAMAAGLPVVISNKVNIWREVEEAGAGLVVNPEAHEVAGAILKLLEEPTLGKKMGERGRRLARESFSWDAAGDQLVALYTRIISGQPHAGAAAPFPAPARQQPPRQMP